MYITRGCDVRFMVRLKLRKGEYKGSNEIESDTWIMGL